MKKHMQKQQLDESLEVDTALNQLEFLFAKIVIIGI